MKIVKKFIDLEIKPDFGGLTFLEKEALRYCIEAAKWIDRIFLKQVFEGNLVLLKKIEKGKDELLKKFFKINYGPWDRFENNEPLIKGIREKPKGAEFYPKDLTVTEWDNWLRKHSEQRENFESAVTIIKRKNGKLIAIPYSIQFQEELAEVSKYLKKAASLVQGKLKVFLETRANAFLTNRYEESEIAWLETNGFPFEITIGPYEVYEDKLLGLKAAFEAFIGIPDKEATDELEHFKSHGLEFDSLLAERFNYSRKGISSPLVVAKDVFRGGECRCGRLFSAYNLPNDRKIIEMKGSKKVFSETLMKAKFNKLIEPIAERVLREKDMGKCRFFAFFLFVLGHEFAHGMGPSVITHKKRKVGIEKLLKEIHSPLEEAKADTLGISFLKYLAEKGAIKEEELANVLLTMIVNCFRDWKESFSSPLSVASLIHYNWLKANKAIFYDRENFSIEPERALESSIQLSERLIELQLKGEYKEAKKFKEKWSSVPSELINALGKLKDLPLDIFPVFNLENLYK